jgi:hypothetical protein
MTYEPLKEKIRILISSFLFPSTRFCFFGDPDAPSDVDSPKTKLDYEYVYERIENMSRIGAEMKAMDDLGVKIRDPFGFGKDIVIFFWRLPIAEANDEFAASLKSKETADIMPYEQRIMKIFKDASHKISKREAIHVIVRSESGFWDYKIGIGMTLKESDDRQILYPSPLQFRNELKNYLTKKGILKVQ